MDYKYIEQLLERYWNAETTLEEENILRTFFCQKDIPAEMEPLRPLFTANAEESLDDDFDARILAMIDEKPQMEKARRVTLTQRLMPLFKAAAVVAIFLTLGQAAQKPWDANWNDPRADYAANYKQQSDSITATPIQAENISEMPIDSVKAAPDPLSKD